MTVSSVLSPPEGSGSVLGDGEKSGLVGAGPLSQAAPS